MRFVNFGSLNIDYTFGVDKIVCAGQTISSVSEQRFPGGKGLNQSLGSGSGRLRAVSRRFDR